MLHMTVSPLQSGAVLLLLTPAAHMEHTPTATMVQSHCRAQRVQQKLVPVIRHLIRVIKFVRLVVSLCLWHAVVAEVSLTCAVCMMWSMHCRLNCFPQDERQAVTILAGVQHVQVQC